MSARYALDGVVEFSIDDEESREFFSFENAEAIKALECGESVSN